MYCEIQGGQGWGNNSKVSSKPLASPIFLLGPLAMQVAFKVTSCPKMATRVPTITFTFYLEERRKREGWKGCMSVEVFSIRLLENHTQEGNDFGFHLIDQNGSLGQPYR